MDRPPRSAARVRALSVWLLVCVAVGLLTACQRDLVPPLISVSEMSPREVERGDRLELRGEGFPQGRPAHVTLRGELHRPGAPAITGAEIEATGVVMSTELIELTVDDALEQRLCGRGDAMAHTTFSGDVEVAFASSAPGAPPLVGTLHDASLDVRPASVHADARAARAAEGERLLAFLGVTPGQAGARGLTLDAVADGSPAARAGLAAGDVLTGVDGVHVAEMSDVAPAPARVVRLAVRHAGASADDVVTLSLVGLGGGGIPAEYIPALFVVAIALATLLLLVAPGPAALAAFERSVGRRLRGRSPLRLASALFGRGARGLASVFASVLVGTFALGPHVVSADADGALLLVVSLALFAAARISRARALLEALRAASGVLACGAALAVSLGGAVVLQGAMQLGELVRAQGGAPWQAAAATMPAAALLALAYLAVLFALERRESDGAALPARAPEIAPARPPVGRVENAELLERLGVFLACALAVAVFFGGWQLPGLSAPPRSLALQVTAGAWFVAKSWLLAAALRGAAAVAPAWTRAEARSFALRRVLPGLAFACAFAFASRSLDSGAAVASTSFESAWGAIVTAALALFAVRTASRVRLSMRRPEPHASPFL